MMVFASFRNSVSEIADFLKRNRPLIRAAEFKGQSGGAGSKRKSAAKHDEDPDQPPTPATNDEKKNRTTQKKQLETIRAFQEGR